jgi:hypothetical protein
MLLKFKDAIKYSFVAAFSFGFALSVPHSVFLLYYPQFEGVLGVYILPFVVLTVFFLDFFNFNKRDLFREFLETALIRSGLGAIFTGIPIAIILVVFSPKRVQMETSHYLNSLEGLHFCLYT